MINSAGMFDWATLYPGPQEKLGYWMIPKYQPNKQGLVYHSAEGYRDTILSLVISPTRQASWICSNMKNGDLFQHYAVSATAWTNGSPDANLRFIGVESEGVVGEPLTEPQVANLRRIAEDCKAYFGWPGLKRPQSEEDWP